MKIRLNTLFRKYLSQLCLASFRAPLKIGVIVEKYLCLEFGPYFSHIVMTLWTSPLFRCVIGWTLQRKRTNELVLSK